MKRKVLIITTLVFFLIVNTNYFWENKLGLFAFPAFIFLLTVYYVLAAVLIVQLFFAIREKFSDRKQIFVITLLTLVLTLTFFYPKGLISFDTLEGKVLLVAQREGAADCLTTFKIKEDNKFVERSVCFGVTETKGNYQVKNDTIFFSNISLGRDDKEYYEFAVIKKQDIQNKRILGDLVRYKNFYDTIGNKLWIIKNDLIK